MTDPIAILYACRAWQVRFADGGAIAYTSPPYGVVRDAAIYRALRNPGAWQTIGDPAKDRAIADEVLARRANA